MASDSVGDNDGTLLGGVKWADSVEGNFVQFEKPSQIVDMGVISPSFNDGRLQVIFLA